MMTYIERRAYAKYDSSRAKVAKILLEIPMVRLTINIGESDSVASDAGIGLSTIVVYAKTAGFCVKEAVVGFTIAICRRSGQ